MKPQTIHLVLTPEASIVRGRGFLNYRWLPLHRLAAEDDRYEMANDYMPFSEVYFALLGIALLSQVWAEQVGLDMEKRLAHATFIYDWMVKHEPYLKASPDPNGLDDDSVNATREIMSRLRPLALRELSRFLGLSPVHGFPESQSGHARTGAGSGSLGRRKRKRNQVS